MVSNRYEYDSLLVSCQELYEICKAGFDKQSWIKSQPCVSPGGTKPESGGMFQTIESFYSAEHNADLQTIVKGLLVLM